MTGNSPVNYFDTLFRHARQNAVLLMNSKGVVISVSSSFTAHFGYTGDDIIGMSAEILFTKEDQEKNLPQRELESVITTGYSSDNNYLVNHDGKPVWVSGESLLSENENGELLIIKIIQDIHAEKVLENQVRLSNEFNQNILGSIRDIFFVINDRQQIIRTNEASQLFFNREMADDSTLNFAEFIAPFDRTGQLAKTIAEAISTKKEFTGHDVGLFTPFADEKFFHVSGSFINNRENTTLLLFMHDITVNKQIEREREDVIGFIGHELRNPLANIVLCNEIMTEAVKRGNMKELEEMLQRSKNNVMRLDKMIRELYDVTKANSGSMELDIGSFQFGDMIREAIGTVHSLQPAYNIIVNGDTNIQVEADRYRLIQVMVNYLSNGIKYSDGNTDVEVTVRSDRDKITVAVKDEGLGIAKEQLPYIFEKFFRAEKTKKMEGIGLGLYLCRQIIKAHHGNVWAESEESKGSTFYFSIPVLFDRKKSNNGHGQDIDNK